MRLWIALLSAWMLMLPLLAQGAEFRAARDLEGFEAAEFSEDRDLYDLRSYREFDGKTLSAQELTDLRQRWKAELERAQREIARLDADPRERWVVNLKRRLQRHRYFSKIDWSLERPAPGFVLVVQRPAKSDPSYLDKLNQLYIPAASRLIETFEREIVKPTGLMRRPGHEMNAIAVLATQGDMDNFRKFVQDPTGYTTATAYDYELQLTVGFQDPFSEAKPLVQQTTMLYQLTKGLQHAYLGVSGNRPASIGVYEGLAMYLGAFENGQPRLRSEPLGWIADAVQDAANNELLLLPLDAWLATPSWEAYREGVVERARSLGRPTPESAALGRAYLAQCEAWPHYLMYSNAERYRAQFLAFIASSLRGKSSLQDVQSAFASFDLPMLSREFLRDACAQAVQRNPKRKHDPQRIDGLFMPKAAIAGGPDPQVSEQPVPLQATVAAFSPQQLAPEANDDHSAHALALQRAVEGDFDGALQDLAQIAPAAAERQARIALERERLNAWIALRSGFLQYQVANKGRVKLSLRGKEFLAPLLAVEDTKLRLGENSGGVMVADLKDLVPLDWVRAALKPEQQGSAPAWARAYALLVLGDERWSKQLKEESAQAAALRQDANQYAELAQTALVARELFVLSKQALPRSEAEANARLESIRKLLSKHLRNQLLMRRIEALRQLAITCYVERQRAQPAGSGLKAPIEKLADGRVRLVYDFDKADEWEDWSAVAEAELPMPFEKGSKPGSYTVRKGAIVSTGSSYYRLRIGFVGPVKVSYAFHFLETAKKYRAPRFRWVVLETPGKAQVQCDPAGDLYLEDKINDDFRNVHPDQRVNFSWTEDALVQLEAGAGSVRALLDGKEVGKLEDIALKSGAIGIYTDSELSIIISKITIEGRIDPEQDQLLQREKIEKDLRDLGFP